MKFVQLRSGPGRQSASGISILFADRGINVTYFVRGGSVSVLDGGRDDRSGRARAKSVGQNSIASLSRAILIFTTRAWACSTSACRSSARGSSARRIAAFRETTSSRVRRNWALDGHIRRWGTSIRGCDTLGADCLRARHLDRGDGGNDLQRLRRSTAMCLGDWARRHGGVNDLGGENVHGGGDGGIVA